MKMLIDYGNTRLKWALHDRSRPGRAPTVHNGFQIGGVFAHAERSLGDALGREWESLLSPQAVLVASVVDAQREAELAEFVRDRLGAVADFIRSPACALDVRNAYAEPERLGVDRFLALAALHAQPRAQVLASIGTALTIDVLAANGQHLGGVICASPTLMRAALRGATARTDANAGHVCEIAENTADAVQSGSVLAAVALIERVRASAATQLNSKPVLVLTGGGADEIAALLPDAERAADLVLHGLARWADAMPDR
ncbi:MAG: type III pantothenate kinase [Dokdonella sp.]